MLARHFRPDIPFSREDANRFLPWVVGLMVCLAGLFLAAAISVHQSSNVTGRLNVNSFQIYIPYAHPDKETLHARLIDMLKTTEGVARVETLSRNSLGKLISPWTSHSMNLEELPLPQVVEVMLHPRAKRIELIAAIEQGVKQIDESIEVESYQRWIDQLLQFARMLRLLAVVLACLVVAGLIAMVVLASRTSLKLHFKTVQLLHNVGAQDDYITRQFVVNGTMMTLMGAVPGAMIAAGIYGAVAWFSGSLSSPLLPQIALLPLHVVAFVALPLFAALIAYIAVRATVQTMIEGMH